MRLLCISILVIVATRQVNVGAHAETSNIVTTAGRFETQRHLRVQERAHDNDNDERTNLPIEEIVSLSALKDTIGILKPTASSSTLLEGASHSTMMNTNTRKRPAEMRKSESKQSKKRQTHADTILAKMYEAREMNKNVQKGEEPKRDFADIIAAILDKSNLGRVFGQVNKKLLSAKTDPKEAFELYQLHLAGNQLFAKQQLLYWVKYADFYNNVHSQNISLLKTLLNFYPIEDLKKIVFKQGYRTLAKRVSEEIQETFSSHGSPQSL